MMQPFDQVKNYFCSPAVEIARRLIRQQYFRAGHQRTGQRNSLLFTTGQFTGAMRHSVPQFYLVQPPLCAFECLRLRLRPGPAVAWRHSPLP